MTRKEDGPGQWETFTVGADEQSCQVRREQLPAAGAPSQSGCQAMPVTGMSVMAGMPAIAGMARLVTMSAMAGMAAATIT